MFKKIIEDFYLMALKVLNPVMDNLHYLNYHRK